MQLLLQLSQGIESKIERLLRSPLILPRLKNFRNVFDGWHNDCLVLMNRLLTSKSAKLAKILSTG